MRKKKLTDSIIVTYSASYSPGTENDLELRV